MRRPFKWSGMSSCGLWSAAAVYDDARLFFGARTRLLWRTFGLKNCAQCFDSDLVEIGFHEAREFQFLIIRNLCPTAETWSEKETKNFSCDFKFVLNSLKSSMTALECFISTHWYSTLQSLQIKSLCHATSFAIIHLVCPSSSFVVRASFRGFVEQRDRNECSSCNGLLKLKLMTDSNWRHFFRN